ncbi:hypothetical protein HAALTHF_36910n [Vreelandella aquamarina]|nr:hypothetical protein HAALTHF_36910n [Halomonas axialensis]
MTASGILIAVSQLGSLLGVSSSGFTLVERLMTLLPNLPTFNPYTVAIGGGTLLFLVLMRRYGKQSLIKVGLPATLADLMAKAGPVFAVVVTTLAAWHWQLAYEHGVAVVGTIPSGLPALSFPWGMRRYGEHY